MISASDSRKPINHRLVLGGRADRFAVAGFVRRIQQMVERLKTVQTMDPGQALGGYTEGSEPKRGCSGRLANDRQHYNPRASSVS